MESDSMISGLEAFRNDLRVNVVACPEKRFSEQAEGSEGPEKDAYHVMSQRLGRDSHTN